MSDEKKEYVFDDAARERATAELGRVDREQAGYPRCGLCGQQAGRLDKFGLRSKTSEAHQEWRAAARAERRTGRR
ncbi:hypothetical protein PU630_07635 [Microbacterium horticulturae]|uniref:Uncharacterized protein n=1 Tax=Microbacterium horticulturae TaxID=3028316 RepID=A0ABY8C6E6_9MICO|nr:hypothetical protein [Microbacterium sp. KACC 23027]WEG10408.1 hypothetical protein PU630_07635 [Microbacterium sp. KACC 23027]